MTQNANANVYRAILVSTALIETLLNTAPILTDITRLENGNILKSGSSVKDKTNEWRLFDCRCLFAATSFYPSRVIFKAGSDN